MYTRTPHTTSTRSGGNELDRISTEKAPAALGPYSQGVSANGLVFTSGQLPIDPATGKIPETIEEQPRQALTNVMNILDAAGAGDIVSVTVYMKDLSEFSAMNSVYAEFFSEPFPSRSCVGADIPKGAKLEISAIALKK